MDHDCFVNHTSSILRSDDHLHYAEPVDYINARIHHLMLFCNAQLLHFTVIKKCQIRKRVTENFRYPFYYSNSIKRSSTAIVSPFLTYTSFMTPENGARSA